MENDVRPGVSTYVRKFFDERFASVDVRVKNAATYEDISCREVRMTAVNNVPSAEKLLQKYFKGAALDYAVSVAPSFSGEVVHSGAGTMTVYSPMSYHLTTICPSYYAFDTKARGGPIRVDGGSKKVEVYTPIAPPRVENITITSPQGRIVVK